MKKERLLLLGGSNCQLNGAKRAALQGIDVILADYTDHPPAAVYAYKHVKASTFDEKACTEAAVKYSVNGVMTMGTDQPVLTAARVSLSLGLASFISADQAFAVTNKKRMKEILTAAGLPTARYCLISQNTDFTNKENAPAKSGPFVIKPLDSQGQRGVFKINTLEEAGNRLNETLSFSRQEEALLEAFFKGDELTVDGYMLDGRLYILAVVDRLHVPDPVHIGVCSGHRYPTVHMDAYEEIKNISVKTAKAFKLENGPFYLQLLINEKNEIIINELACRIGGAFEDVALRYMTGFDILQAVMDYSLGKVPDTRVLKDIDPKIPPNYTRVHHSSLNSSVISF